jgi:hypothetical protein
VPAEVEFPGFTARVVVTGVAQMSWDSGGEGQATTFLVKVRITPNYDPPAGVMLVGGEPIKGGVTLAEVVVDGIALARAR